ncbi:hypothetical protein GJR96_12915 [Haloferax sp. MBLA0076]|uniref:Uncharacterized protein n=1 Tax=Haloferax litoreum TaxID=2666140 RepID=A0A6A8GHZ0_9EURY|nr:MULTISPECIES: hypothetical protein [Haloferax]KAB1194287.1 hypothetical protein Hfx1148_12855 [Haloferax sp. CBA1148]MRX22848.1 hypothetical protein [Haloferax litoreum]
MNRVQLGVAGIVVVVVAFAFLSGGLNAPNEQGPASDADASLGAETTDPTDESRTDDGGDVEEPLVADDGPDDPATDGEDSSGDADDTERASGTFESVDETDDSTSSSKSQTTTVLRYKSSSEYDDEDDDPPYTGATNDRSDDTKSTTTDDSSSTDGDSTPTDTPDESTPNDDNDNSTPADESTPNDDNDESTPNDDSGGMCTV